MVKLGGSVIPIDDLTSDSKKGETLQDAIRSIENFVVIFHSFEFSFSFFFLIISEILSFCVIRKLDLLLWHQNTRTFLSSMLVWLLSSLSPLFLHSSYSILFRWWKWRASYSSSIRFVLYLWQIRKNWRVEHYYGWWFEVSYPPTLPLPILFNSLGMAVLSTHWHICWRTMR